MKIRNFQIPIMFFTLLFLPFVSMSGSSQSASTRVGLPADIEVISATFFIDVSNHSGETVNIHRITADWTEMGVTWNNFRGSYDPAVIGSFLADSDGTFFVDVTDLVRDWVSGAEENYGLLLKQDPTTDGTIYLSSEDGNFELRPKLEICYDSTCVTIQRPGTDQDGVADAYIYQPAPTLNGGSSLVLYTGRIGGMHGQEGYEKQTLVRFDFTIEPPPDGEGCTPGYWKQTQHFDSWTSPYMPATPFSAVFEDAFPGPEMSMTLLQVLSQGGGGLKALGRHTVAALLNAASPDVAYPLTVSEVIGMFNDVYPGGDYEGLKDQFEEYNETFCPLN
jgi:hypothetical protein